MRFALLLLAAPAAASVVTSATVTAALGSQTCAQSGPSARCDLRDGAAYAVINAGGRADLLSMSVSVGGDAINGGWARGSASASYDQMVVIDSGTGQGTLSIRYGLSSCCFGDWGLDIGQGNQHWNMLVPQFTLSNQFTYGVPFRVVRSAYVAASTGHCCGDTYANMNISMQAFDVMADGKSVTMRVVNNPEPASFTLFGLGLYLLSRLRTRILPGPPGDPPPSRQ